MAGTYGAECWYTQRERLVYIIGSIRTIISFYFTYEMEMHMKQEKDKHNLKLSCTNITNTSLHRVTLTFCFGFL